MINKSVQYVPTCISFKCWSVALVSPSRAAQMYASADLKAFLHEEFLQSIIPCPWGLLEAIEGLVKSEDFVRMFWIFKTWWLSNIYFFLNLTIEECTFHIHLV